THLNKYAQIETKFFPELELFNLLLKDSVQAAITSRALNEEEMAYFKSIQRMPQSTLIARDGVALIVSPSVIDTVITLDQLHSICLGNVKRWEEIYAGSRKGEIKMVLENFNGCNARTLMEKFGLEKLPPTFYALETSNEVFEYVKANPESMGIVSLSWLSDEEDSVCAQYRSMIRLMGIIDPTNKDRPTLARRPFQAYVFDNTYPLTRDVYYIRTGLSGSLGTGFGNHLIGEKGQLIIHKLGMVAAKTPNRTVRIIE
ncbi:MAG: PstS family phosphate ABC transporter substrate-binding protein, partial [Flavobacteriales bacterium]